MLLVVIDIDVGRLKFNTRTNAYLLGFFRTISLGFTVVDKLPFL